MDAIEYLTAQHREADALFDQISGSSGDAARTLFEKLADLLAIHTSIEEEIFYPMARNEGTSAFIRHSEAEHNVMKAHIASLLTTDDETSFADGFKRLRDATRTHVLREETQLFPRVLSDLGQQRLEEIALSLEELADEHRQEGAPRRQVVDAGKPGPAAL